jgi:hypothetical protein
MMDIAARVAYGNDTKEYGFHRPLQIDSAGCIREIGAETRHTIQSWELRRVARPRGRTATRGQGKQHLGFVGRILGRYAYPYSHPLRGFRFSRALALSLLVNLPSRKL